MKAGRRKTMAVTCEAHPFDEATDNCKTCGRDFCPDCLVYAHGESKPPFCIPCALVAAGVRREGRVPVKSPGSATARALVVAAVLGGVGAAAVPVASALGMVG
jgi:hypothetical protein